MRRLLLVLGLVIALLIPATATAAADWSMAGGDAARTASTTAETSAFPAIMWATPLPGPLLTAPVVARNPGAAWGATVYALSGGPATLWALNPLNGAPLWSVPLGSLDDPPWTFSSAAGLAANSDHVYVLVTQQDLIASRETLFSLNRVDGLEAWNASGISYGTPGLPIESAPLLARDLVVFGTGSGQVLALSASTGVAVWDVSPGGRFPLPVTFLETGNALVGDFILAPNENGFLLGIDVNGTANGDQGIPDPPGSGDVVWSASLGAPASSAALATPTAAYVGAGSEVFAIHPAFGSVMWTQSIPGGNEGPLSLSGTSLVLGSDDDHVRALDGATGAIQWVRAPGVLRHWIVSTPTKVLTGAGNTIVALNPGTGDVTWTGTYASPVMFGSASENATGAGTIYAGMSSPDRIVAFGGSADLQAFDVTLTPISNPDVFQASVDASIRNNGDENVSRSFHVWVNDTIQGATTVLSDAVVPYLRAREGFTVRIDSWNFTAGTHTISIAVERIPQDRDLSNNAISFKFFASAGPPRTITEWSPAFWIGLIIVGVAGLAVGWMIAVANRRREREASEMARSRQGPPQ